MSYVALYRKFRPDTFDEVKGQDHIVSTLRNQIIYNRVGHAYLFCGTRGTGKTTVAKLLAKAVNCEHPVNGSPCGECESCRAIQAGRALNVVEIDAASNNGVDNIRQINEAVQYAPSQGKYLVYIIDEVHMLSPGAFNALLKTLEEPPAYVIFILATTEDYKVPVTIRSRCQRYDFHRISLEVITARLRELMQREGTEADEDALRYVAKAGDGSMRDALSILDECISASLGKRLTLEQVLKTVGAVDTDVYENLLRALEERNAEQVLDIISDAVWQGKDLTKFTDDLIWYLRNVFFLKTDPALAGSLDLTAETAGRMIEIGKTVSEAALTRDLRELQNLSVNIRYSTIPRVSLEMTLIRLMHPETEQSLDALTERMSRLEKTVSGIQKNPGAFSGSGENTLRKDMAADSPAADSGAVSPAEESRQVLENVKKKYSPTTAEEVVQIAKKLKQEIVPRLETPYRMALQSPDLQIVPGEETPEGIGSIVLVYTGNAEDGKDILQAKLSQSEDLQRLSDTVSEKLQKKIVFRYETRPGAGLKNDRDAVFINKIQFDVDVQDG